MNADRTPEPEAEGEVEVVGDPIGEEGLFPISIACMACRLRMASNSIDQKVRAVGAT